MPSIRLGRQRKVAEAFLAAARGGDLGALIAVLAFTIDDDKISRIDVIADPARLAGLDLAVLDG